MSGTLKRLIISADAGSAFDKIGRAAGEGLQRMLGRDLSLENVGDSAGVGGAEAGARATPDGSTILICNKGAVTSHPHTAKTYRPSDFAALCQVAEAPIAVAVGRDSPFKTLGELIDAARKEPDTISYSTPNPYHTQRLAMQDFAGQNGLAFKFLILPGSNAATIKQLNEGKVHFAFLAAHNLVAPAKAGEIKVLGVAHGSRLPFLQSAPTFREQGFDLVTAIWLGLFAPTGVPASQLAELRQTAEAAMRDTQTTRAIEKIQLVPAFLDHAAFEKKVMADTAFHLNVLHQLGAV
jgi:tripartite-type tricarboxylate transporter receptor subunit TctC